MGAEEKASMKNSVSRVFFAGLAILIQVIWIAVLVIRLNRYSVWISLATTVVAMIVVLRLYGSHANAAFKMPWIMMILALPILGLCMFFLFGTLNAPRLMVRHFKAIDQEVFALLKQEGTVIKEMEDRDLAAANQSRYIERFSHYPVYKDTAVTYYADANFGLRAQIEAMEQAESFIFMEYHAIEDAISFKEVKELLARKAKAGVEVRVFYDDVGSVGFLSPEFIRRMEAEGIKCRVFNPVIPVFNIFMNNRDHRKITVVDGKVGFTGGYNLADEYFNITHPYGHWKDTGIRLEGPAVRNLTAMFLEMWNAIKKTDADYGRYLNVPVEKAKAAGENTFVQPYGDSPMDNEQVGENVYMNLVKNAKKYVYFTTPYLIISDEMTRELALAAKRGVDVRIITPGIPDKKVVYKLTRSYYAGLVLQGVRIFEYTPGFIHAKQCVCDGETAVIGTINLDYRSLYMHFENGVFLYGCDAIKEMKKDFDDTFPLCEEVTEKYRSGRTAVVRLGQCILRLFAPLM